MTECLEEGKGVGNWEPTSVVMTLTPCKPVLGSALTLGAATSQSTRLPGVGRGRTLRGGPGRAPLTCSALCLRCSGSLQCRFTMAFVLLLILFQFC